MTDLQPDIKKDEPKEQVKPTISPETMQAAITPMVKAETPAAAAEEDPKERDWKKWKENRAREREQAKADAEARQKAEKEAAALKAALEAVVNKPTPQYQQPHADPYYQDTSESEDAKIQKRIDDALAKRDAEYRRQREEEEKRTFPQKLEQTYKDFNVVCSQENLDYLDYHHPEVAKALARMPDGFDKWSDVYSAIKRYIPNPESSKDMRKVEKNLQKPQALTHSGITTPMPGGAAIRLDEARRAANWERMQRTLKGLN